MNYFEDSSNSKTAGFEPVNEGANPSSSSFRKRSFMFFSVREEKNDKFGLMLHSIWREDYKVVEDLSWEKCFDFLFDNMLEYDTMQVKTVAGVWYDAVWTKLDIKQYINSIKAYKTMDSLMY